jgi:hypothetical protein
MIRRVTVPIIQLSESAVTGWQDKQRYLASAGRTAPSRPTEWRARIRFRNPGPDKLKPALARPGIFESGPRAGPGQLER